MNNSLKILITGGTGSFGKAFLNRLLVNKKPERVVIYSRDELKQWELQQKYPESEYPNLRFFIGEIRDLNRLKRALENIKTDSNEYSATSLNQQAVRNAYDNKRAAFDDFETAV